MRRTKPPYSETDKNISQINHQWEVKKERVKDEKKIEGPNLYDNSSFQNKKISL
jgi:hypothetical protein